MQRLILHSLSAKHAYAATTSAAAVTAVTAAATRSGLSFTLNAAPCCTQNEFAASRLARIHCASTFSSSALLAQKSFYATGATTGKNQNGIHASKNDAADREAADTPMPPEHPEEKVNGDAIDYSHHTPSLRDALPPSAVELPEESFIKCIEKEMMDEKYRLDKEEGPPPVPAGWTMHHTEGTSFIYGRRVWMPPPAASSSSLGRTPSQDTTNDSEDNKNEREEHAPQQQMVPRAIEKHFLRIQLTARDASLDPECDVRGEHFPFSFFVQRVRPEDADEGNSGNQSSGANVDLNGDAFDEHTFYHSSIEVRCDVVDGELVVDNVVYHGSPNAVSTTTAAGKAAGPHYANPFGGYPGPNLDEAEEEVLDGVQSWLAERGVDDQLGEFVGQYSIWIEQAEYELWLQQLHDYVAA